ncbi:MAG: efflux RND transporter permease subunit [Limnochordia bacterium]|jgi:HAE1 family hydrophobic/amphiphilic exporter-1
MRLNEIAARRPVAVAMGVAVVLLFGFLSITRLELDLLPNLRLPIVGVVTVYPGAAPGAVEGEITTPIETTIATVSGLKSLESYSMENVSVTVATFAWGVDPTRAMNDITAQLATLTTVLPSDAMKPVVANVDPRMFPVMRIGITGLDDISDLTKVAEEHLMTQIEQLPGVAKASLVAGARPEITVFFDTEALRINNTPPAVLYELLKQQNSLVPAGVLEDDSVRYNVRVGNPLSSVEEIRDLVIGEKKTTGLEAAGFAALIPQMLFLKDVAKVVEGTSPQQAYARVNGEPAVILQVYKQSGAGSVSVSRAVRNALSGLAQDAGHEIQLQVLGDQSEFITDALNNVKDAAIVGAILAVAVLLLFLRSVRSIAVIAIAIPLSIVVALIMMYASDLTLNLLSIGGLALGIGTLVDNSIVVLESIIRHRQQGLSALEAAKTGTSKVALAISASTLTTVVVFLPLAYLQSTAGRWFRDMAFTVTFALLASMAVAVTVVPAAAAGFLRRPLRHSASDDHGAGETSFGWIERLQERYLRLLTRVLRRPAWLWAFALVLIVTGLSAPRHMPLELLPSVDGGAINATLTMPAGTPTRMTNNVAEQIETTVSEIEDVAFVWSQVGQDSDDVVQLLYGAGQHVAKLQMLLQPKSKRKQSIRATADEIRRAVEEIDLLGGHLSLSTERLTDSLGEAFSPGATIQVSGKELGVLEELAAQVAGAMRQVGGFTEITTSVDQRQPELLFTVDRTKALLGSMTTGVVGLTLRGALSGLEATRIQRNGESIPVVLRAQPHDIDGIDSLLKLSIQGVPSAGQGSLPSVRFGRVVTTEQASGPVTIQHIGRVRTIAINARLDGIDLGEAKRKALSIIDQLEIPPQTSARLAGVHDTIQEAVDELSWVLVLAILLVYMVMAAQFDSLLYPLIIMTTVPLGIGGGFVCLWITGQSIGVSALMGLIVLTGVVVGNGIMMVDAANQARRNGAGVDEAISLAARERLRPILMTSLTTILGLLPLALGRGEGTELQRPLAIAYMGGMFFSTGLTLFLVPSAYRLLTRRQPVTTDSDASLPA